MRSIEPAASAASRNISAIALARHVMLGVLVVGLLITVQHSKLSEPYSGRGVPSPFSRLELEEPKSPSAFEKELAMSPRQLLDRWNPLVADAATAFTSPPPGYEP